MWISLAIILILGFCIVAFFLPRRKRLDARAQKRIAQSWHATLSQGDAHRRIIDQDKVLDLLLTQLGYKGTVADKLRAAEKIIPDLNAVWRAHKLRNQIAHESGIQISDAEASEAQVAFEKVIAKFIPLSKNT